jgi:hypothetical protein
LPADWFYGAIGVLKVREITLSYLNLAITVMSSTFALIWEYLLVKSNITVCLLALTIMMVVSLIKQWKKTLSCVLVMFFWFMTLFGPVGGYRVENGDSAFLWNVGNHLKDHTMSQPRTPRLTFSSQRESQISDLKLHFSDCKSCCWHVICWHGIYIRHHIRW